MRQEVSVAERTRWRGEFYAILQFETQELKEDLSVLGLDYQEVHGLWKKEKIIVWSTEYSYMDFKMLMLKLNENHKQSAFCIGERQDDVYETIVFEKSRSKPEYEMIKKFSVDDIEQKIDFGQLTHHICLASAKCLMGAYKRCSLCKAYLTGEKWSTLK